MSLIFTKTMDTNAGKQLFEEIKSYWETQEFKDFLIGVFPDYFVIENENKLLYIVDETIIKAVENQLFCRLCIDDDKIELILDKVNSFWQIRIEQNNTKLDKIPNSMRKFLPKLWWSTYTIKDFNIYHIGKDIYVNEPVSCIWLKGFTKIGSVYNGV